MAVDLRLFGILTLCSVLLCLGLVVVIRDPRALVNRLFALSMLTMICRFCSNSLYLSTRDTDPNILLGRIGFASASAIPFSLLWMFESLDDSPRRQPSRFILWAGGACALFIALSLSPLIVAGVNPAARRRHIPHCPPPPHFPP